MSNKSNDYNTLLLVIREKDGIVTKYQRQLYEASLLGISKVKYCLVPDRNSPNSYRLDSILQKCKLTADLFNIKSIPTISACFNASFETSLTMTNDDNIFVGGVSRFSYFEDDKVLKGRKRVGEILIKKRDSLSSKSV